MEMLAIGTIRTSWGIKGWVKLSSFSGEWDHFSSLEKVDLKAPDREFAREYRVEDFRMHQGNGMFKFSGVDSPEAGKQLSGYEILVPREQAAPLSKNEWYLNDLIGLSLVNMSGESYGEIVGLIESADDLLEIQRPDGSRFMIPFRSEFTGKPNLKKGTLELTAPWLAEE